MLLRASNLLSQRLSSNRNILVPRIQIHHRNNKNLFFHPNQILRRSFVLIKRPWIDRKNLRHQYSATKSFTNVVVKRNIIKGTIPEGGHNIAVNHYAEVGHLLFSITFTDQFSFKLTKITTSFTFS